jgi:hypothetical protein
MLAAMSGIFLPKLVLKSSSYVEGLGKLLKQFFISVVDQ